MTHERGFSLVEFMVAMAIALAAIGAVFRLASPASGMFDTELERIDMRQRLHTSADALFQALLVAGAGGALPAVAPFRRGERNPDAVGATYGDRLSVAYVPSDGTSSGETVTFWWRADPDEGGQLMRYDGRQSDLPLADRVSTLRFEYFGADGTAIDRGRFSDGPWHTPVGGEPFDVDLQAIRRVRIRLGVAAVRIMLRAPPLDHEIVFDVSPRNLNGSPGP